MARWRVVVGCWLVIVVVVSAWGAQAVPTARAQGVEGVRAKVQSWLLDKLNKPSLILVQYTYSGTEWPDASLGCPVEGETYEQGIVPGYRWTLEFDNRVRYEVHSNLDGTQAVLCTALNVAPDVRMTVYNTTTFSILIPVAWLIFPNDTQTEFLFAPQQQGTCAEPGMRVTLLGEVASGVAPDQLIDAHLAQMGAQDDTTARTTVGSFGRTTLFDLPCKDTTRRWRVSAFVQSSSATRIEQWSPASDYDQWDQPFLNMLDQFGPPDADFTAAGEGEAEGDSGEEPAAAPAEIVLPSLPVAHVFVNDVFVGALNDIPGRSVTTVPTLERRYLAFSPDGLFLSFVNVTDKQLRILNAVEDLSPRTLANEVYPAFPPAWSPDSSEIAFVVNTGETDADGAALLEIHAVPRTGGDPRTLGAFAFGDDCTMSLSDPADRAYLLEAGPNGQQNVLAWMPDGRFLISPRCEGGLGLLNVTDGTITDLGSDLRGGVLSADRTLFLSRFAEGLAVLDFETWQRTNLKVGPDVAQVAWGVDGETVYYSTETLADSTILDDPTDQTRAEETFGVWPVSIRVYDVALFRLNLTTKQKTVIWQGQGRGIGRIALAPDGSGVLFSLVPSSLLVAEVFRVGADPLSVREAWPDAALYWLPAGSPTAILLAYSGQPAIAPVVVNAG